MEETTFTSSISGTAFDTSEMVLAKTIRPPLYDLIKSEHPDFNPSSVISAGELRIYREKHITGVLLDELGELTDVEKTVIQSITDRTIVSGNLDDDDNEDATFGQRVADKVATFGGSWTFIISFGIFLLLWIASNIVLLSNKGFDPYPFILLNLILSCIAALQAPVIMMSQNRREEKDRERAKNDYMINLKSELEIRMLHEKIDHLTIHQHEQIMEMQEQQAEMMKKLLDTVNGKK
ncbi:MAG: hypothetical protein A3D31_00900 [Candidatus Fluviicola riflensis]|nr:MAG: hypothetical protein CHH17_04640 [Candidatus Fluviicola riflensis]OGS76164.1 MAG: hypothetical protein A3D31_00900 [Candidatus Fluviicola riflensis]OGS83292.1 MAG: hypothetical protein A2724_00940 [Fluviicola sp. RIFCSPHIGHO2_01_FULL_43_53]OGS83696.1 MAG: hypothetical protein A3E30_17505 [Fluviicola sp. RIFCSPHIGHO2_12_FULL_43_24]